MSIDDSGMNMPRDVQQRPWGSYRYKRDVPKRLLSLIGKSHLYRNLGQSYDEMTRKLPKAHQEVGVLFRKVEAETGRERTLAVVEAQFAKEAAEQFDSGYIDDNLENGLWDLHQILESEDEHVDPAIIGNLIGATLPEDVVSLSKAFDLYAEFKDANKNKKLSNSLARTQDDLKISIGTRKLKTLPLGSLTRADALKYRDYLLARVAPNSVIRYINIVRAVINHTTNEYGLTLRNPFHNLKVKGAGNGAGDRLLLSAGEAVAGFDAMGTRPTSGPSIWHSGRPARGWQRSPVCKFRT